MARQDWEVGRTLLTLQLRGPTIARMADLHSGWRGRLHCLLPAVGIIALLGLGSPPAAAQTIPELDKALKELQTKVDQLQKDSLPSQINQVSSQLVVIQKDLAELKLTQVKPGAAPKEAWWSFMVVGAAFAIAWGVVNRLRHRERRDEAILNALVKLDERQQKDTEIRERMALIHEMLTAAYSKDTGPPSRASLLKWLENLTKPRAGQTTP